MRVPHRLDKGAHDFPHSDEKHGFRCLFLLDSRVKFEEHDDVDENIDDEDEHEEDIDKNHRHDGESSTDVGPTSALDDELCPKAKTDREKLFLCRNV